MCIIFILFLLIVWLVFFFFQAEDGIRDDLVTGVQTCALPIQAVGGIEAMRVKLGAIDQLRGATTGGQGSVLSFVPDVGSAWMPMITFFVYIAVNWWATWYPGAEPGGGGYVAQRMLSAKAEKNSLLATLWFNIAHYAIRPWPWILVALASLI